MSTTLLSAMTCSFNSHLHQSAIILWQQVVSCLILLMRITFLHFKTRCSLSYALRLTAAAGAFKRYKNYMTMFSLIHSKKVFYFATNFIRLYYFFFLFKLRTLYERKECSKIVLFISFYLNDIT